MQTRTSRTARGRRRGNGDEGNHSRRPASPARRRSRGEWESLAREWLASGLTAREFSDGRASLNATSLKWWAWNLGLSKRARDRTHGENALQEGGERDRGPSSSSAASEFLPVRILPSNRASTSCIEPTGSGEIPTLEVILHSGRIVRLRGQFSASTFKDIVRVLEDVS